jgi:hypothetical protein
MKNWQTRISGLLTLALIGMKAAANPGVLADPTVLAAITAGLGLVFAKQHNVTGGTVPQAGGTEPAGRRARSDPSHR